MLIKVEPAGFFMYTVQFSFDVESPDSEDQAVRDYLAEHDLEPRYQWDAEENGRKYQWMQFGGCYLGSHLQGIGQLQRSAVEVELLTEEIDRILDAVLEGIKFSSLERRAEIVAQVVKEFQRESSFTTNDNGELTAVLDRVEVVAAVRARLSGS